MSGLSLREAAQQAGTSKSTILRAIRAGRLSASRTDDGGYGIQPAELFRVCRPKKEVDKDTDRSADRAAGQDATGAEQSDALEMRMRNVALRAQLEALKQVLEIERQRAEELRDERDKWQTHIERLIVALPDLRPQSSRTPHPARPEAKPVVRADPWWPWRRRA